MYVISELYSQADTTVVGGNIWILQYANKYCDVFTYHDDYDSVKGAPTVHT